MSRTTALTSPSTMAAAQPRCGWIDEAPPGCRMEAVVNREFGGLEVLRLEEVPIPTTGPDELLVREPGQASPNIIRAAWPRDHLASEPVGRPDVVAQLRTCLSVRPKYAPV